MKLIQELQGLFKDYHETSPRCIARAPGRVEILGNHTDYNQGLVLSAAVDRAAFFLAAPAENNDDDLCTVSDACREENVRFRLSELENPRPGEWINYIKGMVVQLRNRGITVPPFNGLLYSTVPLSAGMSSSAALEMASGLALSEMTGGQLSKLDLARCGQACENDYVGANTGLLDQISSMHGKEDCLVYSDFRSLEIGNIHLPTDVAMVIADSGVKHDLTGTYNQRRADCEEAVQILAETDSGIGSLRDVNVRMLEENRSRLPLNAYRRALHVVQENERVLKGVEALRAGEVSVFGQLLFDSHDSSRYNFENSCPELDTLVELGKSLPGIIGARLSGGGFGGITVHLVQENEVENFTRRLQTAWRTRTERELPTFVCRAADGAGVINNKAL